MHRVDKPQRANWSYRRNGIFRNRVAAPQRFSIRLLATWRTLLLSGPSVVRISSATAYRNSAPFRAFSPSHAAPLR